MKKIDSPQNAYIKTLIQLQEKSKNRKQTGTFIIEGQREIQLAQKGHYALQTLLYCPEYIEQEKALHGIGRGIEIIEISKDVYQKLAYRDTTEGLLAIAKTKSLQLSDLKLSATPLILVAEAPEKPGNIGALLRTADAANVDAVIIANPKSDLYNPNIIRSSVGAVFTTQIAMASTAEAINYLKSQNIAIYCATLQDSTAYHSLNYQEAAAFVVGTEASGLTDEWRLASTQNIIIPMSGEIDSMNVSVAASILIFEAKRQRGF